MKIAAIRFSALGDIASLTPILKSLKYRPTIITSNIGYEFLKDEFDKFLILPNKTILSQLKLLREMRKNKFDMIIDFQCNDRSTILSKLSNSKSIINNQDIDVYNNSVFDIFYKIAKKSKILNDIDTKFYKKEKNYIVFNCGSSAKWLSKRVPTKKWREFSQIITEKFNLPIYLTGDKNEYEYIKTIEKELIGKIKNLAGKTSIQELKTILANAYLTISTDSAAMHISAVQKTPTIGIFGATNWIRSKPFGEWSVALYDKKQFQSPPKKNRLEVGNYYDNININIALKKLERFL